MQKKKNKQNTDVLAIRRHLLSSTTENISTDTIAFCLFFFFCLRYQLTNGMNKLLLEFPRLFFFLISLLGRSPSLYSARPCTTTILFRFPFALSLHSPFRPLSPSLYPIPLAWHRCVFRSNVGPSIFQAFGARAQSIRCRRSSKTRRPESPQRPHSVRQQKQNKEQNKTPSRESTTTFFGGKKKTRTHTKRGRTSLDFVPMEN